jgi:hypothetical protein
VRAPRLLLMISWAALTPGAVYASSSNPASQQKSSASSADVSDHSHDSEHAAPADNPKPGGGGDPDYHPRVQRRIAGKAQPHNLAAPTGFRPKQPQRLPNNSEHFVPPNAMNHHPEVSGKSGNSRTGAFIQNKTGHSAPTVRPLGVIQPALPVRSTVRYRAAGPVVIGGPVISGSRNIGTIDGTRTIRRP